MKAHPAVTRTWATLRIGGKTLDPEMVTLRLGIDPSNAFKVGDRFGKDGSVVRKHGHWSLTSEGNLTSTDL